MLAVTIATSCLNWLVLSFRGSSDTFVPCTRFSQYWNKFLEAMSSKILISWLLFDCIHMINVGLAAINRTSTIASYLYIYSLQLIASESSTRRCMGDKSASVSQWLITNRQHTMATMWHVLLKSYLAMMYNFRVIVSWYGHHFGLLISYSDIGNTVSNTA